MVFVDIPPALILVCLFFRETTELRQKIGLICLLIMICFFNKGDWNSLRILSPFPAGKTVICESEVHSCFQGQGRVKP